MRTVPPFLLLSCMLLAPPIVGQEPAAVKTVKANVQNSVVRVMARQQVPEFSAPWMPAPAERVSGSGVVIEGNRILTSAHLVTYAMEVTVQPFNAARFYPATVAALAAELDLAVLEVQDPQFFNNHPPVKLAADLPRVGESLQLYGFPEGGAALRPAGAVVSRIEYGRFEYDAMGLRIEVNGVVDPGNSGGPAINERGMVGLVYGASIFGQNIGYLIAAEEIRTFLDDVEDGHYEGKPRMWIDFQKLENPALRAALQLPDETTGVMVRASRQPTENYPLQCRDVITKIGDHAIDNEGMVYLADKDLRVFFTYLAPPLAKDGRAPLTVIRDGKEQCVEAPVAAQWDFLVPSLRGEQPSYFIWGPLALAPATEELVDALAPMLIPIWSVRQSPLLVRRHDFRKFPEEEMVMATILYPHETSRGYSSPAGQVVSHVNGTSVRNLRHLVELLRQANAKQEKFVVLRFADRFSDTLVFDRQAVMNAADEILLENRVFRRGSEELLKVWNGDAPQ